MSSDEFSDGGELPALKKRRLTPDRRCKSKVGSYSELTPDREDDNHIPPKTKNKNKNVKKKLGGGVKRNRKTSDKGKEAEIEASLAVTVPAFSQDGQGKGDGETELSLMDPEKSIEPPATPIKHEFDDKEDREGSKTPTPQEVAAKVEEAKKRREAKDLAAKEARKKERERERAENDLAIMREAEDAEERRLLREAPKKKKRTEYELALARMRRDRKRQRELKEAAKTKVECDDEDSADAKDAISPFRDPSPRGPDVEIMDKDGRAIAAAMGMDDATQKAFLFLLKKGNDATEGLAQLRKEQGKQLQLVQKQLWAAAEERFEQRYQEKYRKKKKKRGDYDDSSSSDDDLVSEKQRRAAAKKSLIKQAPADLTGGDLHEVLTKNADEVSKKALAILLNQASGKNKDYAESSKKLFRSDSDSGMAMMFVGHGMRRTEVVKRIAIGSAKKSVRNLESGGWPDEVVEAVRDALDNLNKWWSDHVIDCIVMMAAIMKLLMFSAPRFYESRVQSLCDAAVRDKFSTTWQDYADGVRFSDLLKPEIIQRTVNNSALNAKAQRNKGGRRDEQQGGQRGGHGGGYRGGGGRGRGRGRGSGGGFGRDRGRGRGGYGYNDMRCNMDRDKKECTREVCRFSHIWRDGKDKKPDADKPG